jgi:hypothetical protein
MDPSGRELSPILTIAALGLVAVLSLYYWSSHRVTADSTANQVHEENRERASRVGTAGRSTVPQDSRCCTNLRYQTAFLGTRDERGREHMSISNSQGLPREGKADSGKGSASQEKRLCSLSDAVRAAEAGGVSVWLSPDERPDRVNFSFDYHATVAADELRTHLRLLGFRITWSSSMMDGDDEEWARFDTEAIKLHLRDREWLGRVLTRALSSDLFKTIEGEDNAYDRDYTGRGEGESLFPDKGIVLLRFDDVGTGRVEDWKEIVFFESGELSVLHHRTSSVRVHWVSPSPLTDHDFQRHAQAIAQKLMNLVAKQQ